MTRETKIGLLVGLAFIIVIGILLSDHLTSATEPPQAQLAQVGNNVRSTTNTPGTNRAGNPAGGIFNNATNQQPATPTHPVLTQNELANRTAPPVQIINVGGPANGQAQNPNSQTTNPNDPPITMAPPHMPEASAPDSSTPQNPQGPIVNTKQGPLDPINEIARRNGEELVGPNNEPIKPAVNNTSGNNTTVPMSNNVTTYVAQSGDNISKIARKTLGSDSKANREAIINANPSLKTDANKIISGKTYMIPAKTVSTPTPTPEPVAPDRTTQKPASTTTTDHWYTVKEGDSLWKIAESQCGSGKAVSAIKELNKDILKNDVVQAGQKIRLPNAPAKQG